MIKSGLDLQWLRNNKYKAGPYLRNQCILDLGILRFGTTTPLTSLDCFLLSVIMSVFSNPLVN
jgi:hypothetical protein